MKMTADVFLIKQRLIPLQLKAPMQPAVTVLTELGPLGLDYFASVAVLRAIYTDLTGDKASPNKAEMMAVANALLPWLRTQHRILQDTQSGLAKQTRQAYSEITQFQPFIDEFFQGCEDLQVSLSNEKTVTALLRACESTVEQLSQHDAIELPQVDVRLLPTESEELPTMLGTASADASDIFSEVEQVLLAEQKYIDLLESADAARDRKAFSRLASHYDRCMLLVAEIEIKLDEQADDTDDAGKGEEQQDDGELVSDTDKSSLEFWQTRLLKLREKIARLPEPVFLKMCLLWLERASEIAQEVVRLELSLRHLQAQFASEPHQNHTQTLLTYGQQMSRLQHRINLQLVNLQIIQSQRSSETYVPLTQSDTDLLGRVLDQDEVLLDKVVSDLAQSRKRLNNLIENLDELNKLSEGSHTQYQDIVDKVTLQLKTLAEDRDRQDLTMNALALAVRDLRGWIQALSAFPRERVGLAELKQQAQAMLEQIAQFDETDFQAFFQEMHERLEEATSVRQAVAIAHAFCQAVEVESGHVLFDRVQYLLQASVTNLLNTQIQHIDAVLDKEEAETAEVDSQALLGAMAEDINFLQTQAKPFDLDVSDPDASYQSSMQRWMRQQGSSAQDQSLATEPAVSLTTLMRPDPIRDLSEVQQLLLRSLLDISEPGLQQSSRFTNFLAEQDARNLDEDDMLFILDALAEPMKIRSEDSAILKALFQRIRFKLLFEPNLLTDMTSLLERRLQRARADFLNIAQDYESLTETKALRAFIQQQLTPGDSVLSSQFCDAIREFQYTFLLVQRMQHILDFDVMRRQPKFNQTQEALSRLQTQAVKLDDRFGQLLDAFETFIEAGEKQRIAKWYEAHEPMQVEQSEEQEEPPVTSSQQFSADTAALSSASSEVGQDQSDGAAAFAQIGDVSVSVSLNRDGQSSAMLTPDKLRQASVFKDILRKDARQNAGRLLRNLRRLHFTPRLPSAQQSVASTTGIIKLIALGLERLNALPSWHFSAFEGSKPHRDVLSELAVELMAIDPAQFYRQLEARLVFLKGVLHFVKKSTRGSRGRRSKSRVVTKTQFKTAFGVTRTELQVMLMQQILTVKTVQAQTALKMAYEPTRALIKQAYAELDDYVQHIFSEIHNPRLPTISYGATLHEVLENLYQEDALLVDLSTYAELLSSLESALKVIEENVAGYKSVIRRLKHYQRLAPNGIRESDLDRLEKNLLHQEYHLLKGQPIPGTQESNPQHRGLRKSMPELWAKYRAYEADAQAGQAQPTAADSARASTQRARSASVRQSVKLDKRVLRASTEIFRVFTELDDILDQAGYHEQPAQAASAEPRAEVLVSDPDVGDADKAEEAELAEAQPATIRALQSGQTTDGVFTDYQAWLGEAAELGVQVADMESDDTDYDEIESAFSLDEFDDSIAPEIDKIELASSGTGADLPVPKVERSERLLNLVPSLLETAEAVASTKSKHPRASTSASRIGEARSDTTTQLFDQTAWNLQGELWGLQERHLLFRGARRVKVDEPLPRLGDVVEGVVAQVDALNDNTQAIQRAQQAEISDTLNHLVQQLDALMLDAVLYHYLAQEPAVLSQLGRDAEQAVFTTIEALVEKRSDLVEHLVAAWQRRIDAMKWHLTALANQWKFALEADDDSSVNWLESADKAEHFCESLSHFERMIQVLKDFEEAGDSETVYDALSEQVQALRDKANNLFNAMEEFGQSRLSSTQALAIHAQTDWDDTAQTDAQGVVVREMPASIVLPGVMSMIAQSPRRQNLSEALNILDHVRLTEQADSAELSAYLDPRSRYAPHQSLSEQPTVVAMRECAQQLRNLLQEPVLAELLHNVLPNATQDTVPPAMVQAISEWLINTPRELETARLSDLHLMLTSKRSDEAAAPAFFEDLAEDIANVRSAEEKARVDELLNGTEIVFTAMQAQADRLDAEVAKQRENITAHAHVLKQARRIMPVYLDSQNLRQVRIGRRLQASIDKQTQRLARAKQNLERLEALCKAVIDDTKQVRGHIQSLQEQQLLNVDAQMAPAATTHIGLSMPAIINGPGAELEHNAAHRSTTDVAGADSDGHAMHTSPPARRGQTKFNQYRTQEGMPYYELLPERNKLETHEFNYVNRARDPSLSAQERAQYSTEGIELALYRILEHAARDQSRADLPAGWGCLPKGIEAENPEEQALADKVYDVFKLVYELQKCVVSGDVDSESYWRTASDFKAFAGDTRGLWQATEAMAKAHPGLIDFEQLKAHGCAPPGGALDLRA